MRLTEDVAGTRADTEQAVDAVRRETGALGARIDELHGLRQADAKAARGCGEGHVRPAGRPCRIAARRSRRRARCDREGGRTNRQIARPSGRRSRGGRACRREARGAARRSRDAVGRSGPGRRAGAAERARRGRQPARGARCRRDRGTGRAPGRAGAHRLVGGLAPRADRGVARVGREMGAAGGDGDGGRTPARGAGGDRRRAGARHGACASQGPRLARREARRHRVDVRRCGERACAARSSGSVLQSSRPMRGWRIRFRWPRRRGVWRSRRPLRATGWWSSPARRRSWERRSRSRSARARSSSPVTAARRSRSTAAPARTSIASRRSTLPNALSAAAAAGSAGGRRLGYGPEDERDRHDACRLGARRHQALPLDRRRGRARRRHRPRHHGAARPERGGEDDLHLARARPAPARRRRADRPRARPGELRHRRARPHRLRARAPQPAAGRARSRSRPASRRAARPARPGRRSSGRTTRSGRSGSARSASARSGRCRRASGSA